MNATEAPEVLPLSSALVIGVGGSGIQTLARLRRAVRDDSRPSISAVDNIKLLGIDAVDITGQMPELPIGTTLGTDEYLNVCRDAFNPRSYVRQRLASDAWLNSWWDPSYVPPDENLTKGLKRSRMLGRLAFHRSAMNVNAAIRDSMSQALEADSQMLGRARMEAAGQLTVFVLAGTTGGTGSSGFAQTLYGVHLAAKSLNVKVDVWPVLFLPNVVQKVYSSKPHLERAHLSNAYAFFKELDAFISVDGTLDDLFVAPGDMRLGISAQEIAKGVICIGSQLGDGHVLAQADVYELAATALFELLLTDAGRPEIGVLGTNELNELLQSFDDKDMRTGYLGVGVRRAVFAGSTYRRFLRMRTRALILENSLLGKGSVSGDDTDSIVAIAEHSGLAPALEGALTGLISRLRRAADGSREAAVFKGHAKLADPLMSPQVQDRAHEASMLKARLRGSELIAAQSVETALRLELRELSGLIDGEVDRVLSESGQGIRVLQRIIQKVTDSFSSSADRAEMQLRSHQTAVERALASSSDPGSLDQAEAQLLQYLQKPAALRAVSRKEDDLIRSFEAVAVEYASNVIDARLKEAQWVLTGEIHRRLVEVGRELESAYLSLQMMAAEATSGWQRDDFEGKDAGPLDMTFYVPSELGVDIGSRQVENTAFAGVVWDKVSRHLSTEPAWTRGQDGVGKLKELYDQWWNPSEIGDHSRGLVGLGSGNAQVSGDSRRRLDDLLDRQVSQIIRESVTLPKDIFEAAKSTGGEVELMTALRNQSDSARTVAVNIDTARIFRQGGLPMAEPTIVYSSTLEVLGETPAPPDVDVRKEDSGDGEQVVAFTMLVGFPFHALSGVDSWRHRYGQVVNARRARGARADDPPMHIDKTFGSRLPDPFPRLNDDASIARLVAQASTFLFMSADARDQFLGSGEDDLPVRIVSVPRQDDSFASTRVYVGREARWDESGRVSWGRDIALGSTFQDLFDGIAGQSPVQSSIRDAYLGFGTEAGLGSLVDYWPECVDALRRAASDAPEGRERQLRELVLSSAVTLKVEADSALAEVLQGTKSKKVL